jgi:hypothetical protein
VSDIEFKVGDADIVGAQLKENGVGINLTGYTVSLVMKSSAGDRVTIPCTLNGTVNGVSVPATAGGVTIPFAATHTATAGNYRFEFLISNGTTVARIPSGNNYFTLTVWEAL